MSAGKPRRKREGRTGFVSLAGAGPGDPALITVAAVAALARADVVVYDRLVAPALLDLAPERAERVFAGKAKDAHVMTQDEINALLVAKAREGKRVVRLKGGDPFVFGRGGEEAEALAAAGIAFEVIPGVTSAFAAPAYAGIPVTHRGLASSVAVVTGHEDPTKQGSAIDWAKLATGVDTLVFLMGTATLPQIAERLAEHGRPPGTPVAVVRWGTTPRQQTVTGTLADIVGHVRDAALEPPTLTVVGQVAALRERLRWFDNRPLFGKRVLVTRTRAQASELSRALAAAGAEPIELPALEIEPCFDAARLRDTVERLASSAYDWLIFTSANAVDVFFDFAHAEGRDARLVRARLAAIGPGTAAALARRGLRADVTPPPDAATAEGLLDALAAEIDPAGATALLPRAEGGREALPEGLRERGATVDELTLYRARPPAAPNAEALRRLRAGEIDAVTFASSSSVRNLLALLGEETPLLAKARIACIGPITAATAAALLGRAPDVVAGEHTIEGLVTALAEAFDDDDR